MTASAVGSLLAGLAIIVALARLCGALFQRFGQPAVVGEILVGVVLGPTFFGIGLSNKLFPLDQVRPALGGLANVGLVLFMFIVGYELELNLVRASGRAAAAVSFGSIAAPLGLGIILGLWLAHQQHVTHAVSFALFIGVAISITAFPVLARILTDRGMQRTKLGTLALASAAVGDVTAWTLLAIVVVISQAAGATSQWRIVLLIPYALVMWFVVRPLLRWVASLRDKAGRLTPDILVIVLVGLILSAYATQWMGLHFIFGAFLFGAIMPRVDAEQMRYEILERLEQLSVLVLLPVYFVLAGLGVNLSSFGGQSAVDLVLILAVAIVGKFAGAYVAARLQRVRHRQAGALATLMNTRGLTEIVILTVGLQLGILNVQLYSLMVVMALLTTAMTGPVLSVIYPKRLIDRDIMEAEQAALGTIPSYRVLVATTGSDADAALLALGAALLGGHSPGELVVSRLLPYRTTRLEIGTGLSGELVDMTLAMAELEALAAPWRERGVAVSPLARFSADPAADLVAQATTADAAVLVIARDHPDYRRVAELTNLRLVTATADAPASWPAVLVRTAAGSSGQAAVKVGLQLAAAQGARLVIDPGTRPGRRLETLVAEIGRAGMDAALGHEAGDGALVVAPAGSPVTAADVLVRAEPDFEAEDADELVRGLVSDAPVIQPASSGPITSTSGLGQPADSG
jgi:Kef-type K+ transport system membrane component KefB